MHFKKSIFYKLKSVPFFLAFLIIFLSFIPRTSSPDLCDLPPEQAIKAYSRAEWAVIYKLDELGIQLTDEMSEGLSKTITKLDLEPAPHEILSKGIDNIMSVADEAAVGEFFENIGKFGDDVEGLDEVIKITSSSNNAYTYRHTIAHMRHTANRFPGENVVFEAKTTGFGEFRLDTFVPGKAALEIKTVTNWHAKLSTDIMIKSFFKKNLDQAIAQAKFAKKKGIPYEYIFSPPFPENIPSDRIDSFWDILETEWEAVFKVKRPVFTSI